MSRAMIALAMVFVPSLLWPAEGTKTMIVYPTSRYVTLNHACFREEACEREVVSLLEKIPGVANVMSHRRQGAIMLNWDRGKMRPEELAEKVLRVMDEKGFGRFDFKITGSRTIPNKLAVRLFPGRVVAISERFA